MLENTTLNQSWNNENVTCQKIKEHEKGWKIHNKQEDTSLKINQGRMKMSLLGISNNIYTNILTFRRIIQIINDFPFMIFLEKNSKINNDHIFFKVFAFK